MVEENKNVVDVEHTLSIKRDPYDFELSNSASQMYALSIGIQRDPMDTKELNFTYEGADNF